jgi:hypothetical protein
MSNSSSVIFSVHHEISKCLTNSQKVSLTCDDMDIRPTKYRIIVSDVTHYWVPGICGVQKQTTAHCQKELQADELTKALFISDCNGKDSCHVPASAIFLSKCKTLTNYLHVTYTCVPGRYKPGGSNILSIFCQIRDQLLTFHGELNRTFISKIYINKDQDI